MPCRRPERADDARFLLDLFAEAQGAMLAGLDPALRDMLVRQQLAGQAMTYRAAYPRARFEIVECDGIAVGRIVTDLAADAVTLVDIALRADWRGRGIGTRLIDALMREAASLGVPVRLTVLATNAGAQRLYARLGFVPVAASEVDVRMEWRPPGPVASGAPEPNDVPSRPVFPDRLRLPLAFDAAAMAADVARLTHADWIAHFVPQNYDGDWSVIPLRGKAGATHPVMMIYADPTCRDFADTPFLAACPGIRAALARFACPLEAVRLMRLGPGSVIKAHRDHDLDYERGSVRIHVPIATNPDVDFRLSGQRVALAPGSAWYLRLSDTHSVENRGTTARIHLVIDARVDAWIETLFAAALAEAA